MKKYLFILVIGLMVFGLAGYSSMGASVAGSHAGGATELVAGSAQLIAVPLTSPDVSGAADVKIAFEQRSTGDGSMGSFFSNNWGVLVMGFLGFLDVVARLTPTEKDNSIINLLTTVVNALIPNFKKGGGRF